MKRSSMALILMMMMFAAFGCDQAPNSARANGGGQARGDGPYTVITTTAMIADIARNVAGDRANVRALMGAGVDPHLYRPTRDDVAALLAADVIFYNGLNLEGKMGDTLVKIAGQGKPVHAVTELLDQEYLLEPEEFEGHYDPHVWMDPRGWMKAAEVVMEKLIAFDPANAESYRSNGQAYLDAIRAVDAYARGRLATVPQAQRVLVTAHDAFNYFARAYGIEVRGIQGISTDSEAGLQQIESLVNLLVDRKVRAVFTESSVSDKNIRALVDGARARGHDVAVGGELFSDAMGAEGTYEGTYVGMIDHNVTTMVRALGGEAPQRGMSGKLHSP